MNHYNKILTSSTVYPYHPLYHHGETFSCFRRPTDVVLGAAFKSRRRNRTTRVCTCCTALVCSVDRATREASFADSTRRYTGAISVVGHRCFLFRSGTVYTISPSAVGTHSCTVRNKCHPIPDKKRETVVQYASVKLESTQHIFSRTQGGGTYVRGVRGVGQPTFFHHLRHARETKNQHCYCSCFRAWQALGVCAE